MWADVREKVFYRTRVSLGLVWGFSFSFSLRCVFKVKESFRFNVGGERKLFEEVE